MQGYWCLPTRRIRIRKRTGLLAANVQPAQPSIRAGRGTFGVVSSSV
jgi:hypothetical protein